MIVTTLARVVEAPKNTSGKSKMCRIVMERGRYATLFLGDFLAERVSKEVGVGGLMRVTGWLKTDIYNNNVNYTLNALDIGLPPSGKGTGKGAQAAAALAEGPAQVGAPIDDEIPF